MWDMWRRKSKGAGAPIAQGASNARPPATVTLRRMTEPEFARFKAFMYEDYAAAISRGMDVPVEEVRDRAAQQTDELLKDGLASESHILWKIVAGSVPDGEAVGNLWVHMDREKQQAFIYFIGIDDQYRGKGYARAAMLALEAAVKPMGAKRLALNVFGDNTTARHLYESLGYEPSAISMRKDI
jgi:ribosomal protein S18 acetylase RimI-like enzyme